MKKILIAGVSGTAGKTIATTLTANGEYAVYGLTHKAENQSLIHHHSAFLKTKSINTYKLR